jgi:hypothetical protein
MSPFSEGPSQPFPEQEVHMASAPSFTTDRIRNVVVVGHGGSGKTTLIDACCHASGASKRHGSADRGHRAHHVHPRRGRARHLHERVGGLRHLAGRQDQLHRHPRLPGLPGRDQGRDPRGRRRAGVRLRPQRGGGGHRPGLGAGAGAPPPRRLLRDHDGPPERRLRARLPGREGAPHPQGDPGGGADRGGRGLPRDRQPLRRPRLLLQGRRHQTGEYDEATSRPR